MKLINLIGENSFKSGVLSSRVNSGNDEVYILTLSSLSNKFISSNYCEPIITSKIKNAKYLSKKHDIVVKNFGEYGVCYINEDNIILPSFVHILRIEDEHIRKFVFMSLCTEEFMKYILSKNGSDSIKRISLNELKDFELGEFTYTKHIMSNIYMKQEQLEMLYYDLNKYNELKKHYIINQGGIKK